MVPYFLQDCLRVQEKHEEHFMLLISCRLNVVRVVSTPRIIKRHNSISSELIITATFNVLSSNKKAMKLYKQREKV